MQNLNHCKYYFSTGNICFNIIHIRYADQCYFPKLSHKGF